MKWLISGGAGFIGKALVKQLLSDPENKIRIYDNLSVGSTDDLKQAGISYELNRSTIEPDWSSRVELITDDILNLEKLISAASEADVFVHLAANTGVAPSVDNPSKDCQMNVVGTLNALEACRQQRVKRFIFASSGAPLGVQSPPLNEEMAPRPASPYGASKLAGEGYCSAYFHSFGIETVGLRFGNVYGPGSNNKSSVIAKFLRQALQGAPLEVYGDGAQTRDFIFIFDLVEAIIKASSVSGIGGELFQIATAQEHTVLEVLSKIRTKLNQYGIAVPEVNHSGARIGDVLRNYSDTSKALQRLGWQPRVNLDDGIELTLQYFLNLENQKDT